MGEIELFDNFTNIEGISKKSLDKIKARLPEYHRVKRTIGTSGSQTSYSLQTMTMLSDSPLSRVKQCYAWIDKKIPAIEESYYEVEKMKLDIIDLEKIISSSITNGFFSKNKVSGNEVDKAKLEIRRLTSLIATREINMSNSLRQVGMFQDMAESILKHNNIDDNWSEVDFEKQEIENMIRKSFRLAIQDITATGRPSKAVVEWWEQLGIHPQLAELITVNYLKFVETSIVEDKKCPIKFMYDFLDKMAEDFKDTYKEALKRIGLDDIGSKEFMAGVTKPN